MKNTETRDGFCIFVATVCEGVVPLWWDEKGWPVVFATEVEAQREIAEDLVDRLGQFLCGEREFDDAITVEEYVAPVTQYPDGVVVDENGYDYRPR